jgi:hypothetical protein
MPEPTTAMHQNWMTVQGASGGAAVCRVVEAPPLQSCRRALAADHIDDDAELGVRRYQAPRHRHGPARRPAVELLTLSGSAVGR